MPEKMPNSAETERQVVNPYEDMDRSTVDAIASLREEMQEDSSTPHGDLRTAVRETLENSGDPRAFRRVYDMDNAQLDSFVDGAAIELKDRKVSELQAIIDAYDNNESFADRRTALREALEAAGDGAAFRKVFDMNNLDITNFVNDARHQLEDETRLDEEAAVNEAYSEYEQREGVPYDATPKSPEAEKSQVERDIEDIARYLREHAEAQEVRDRLKAILDALDAGEEEELTPPKDENLFPEPKESADEENEEIVPPKDEELFPDKKEGSDTPEEENAEGDEEAAEETDEGDEEVEEETDDGSDSENKDHEGDGGTQELEPVAPEKTPWWGKRAWNRLNQLYLGAISLPGRGIERLRSSDRKKTIAAIGAVAVVGTTVAGLLLWKYGVIGGGHGGAVKDALPTGGGKGGNTAPSNPGEFLPPTPKPSLPSSEGFAYPWNWAEAAGHNEDWLHQLGDAAQSAGHVVEWHGSGAHEWVSVDGNSDTQSVIDALRQFAS